MDIAGQGRNETARPPGVRGERAAVVRREAVRLGQSATSPATQPNRFELTFP